MYISSILPELEYVTISVNRGTSVKQVLQVILERCRFSDKDDNLFYLSLQLTDPNPTQEGLTRKTLILDINTKITEYITCQHWFDSKFMLRIRPGINVRIFTGVLMEDTPFVDLLLRYEVYLSFTAKLSFQSI